MYVYMPYLCSAHRNQNKSHPLELELCGCWENWTWVFRNSALNHWASPPALMLLHLKDSINKFFIEYTTMEVVIPAVSFCLPCHKKNQQQQQNPQPIKHKNSFIWHTSDTHVLGFILYTLNKPLLRQIQYVPKVENNWLPDDCSFHCHFPAF